MPLIDTNGKFSAKRTWIKKTPKNLPEFASNVNGTGAIVNVLRVHLLNCKYLRQFPEKKRIGATGDNQRTLGQVIHEKYAAECPSTLTKCDGSEAT